MIKAAIFDIDGTILDSMQLWLNSGELYLKNLGIEPAPGLSAILFPMSLEEGGQYLKDTYLPQYTVTQIIAEITEYLFSSYTKSVLPKNGVKEFLQKFEALNIPTAAATSGRKELFMPVFEKFGLSAFFKAFFTCSEYRTSKTKPDIYLAAADFLKTKVKNTLVFEDSLIPLETAAKAGFKTAGVQDEASICDREKIKKVSSIYIENYLEFDWRNIERI